MSIWSDYKGTRFKVDTCLGQGGMGAVYRAYDNELKRQVAIKVLKKSVVDKPSTRQRFIREALCLSRLSHPSILKIYGVEEDAKCPYLIQEYLKGRDLQSLVLKEGPVSEQQARSILADVASALACMHEAKIYHRDLKPSNIFITEEGRAVVLDFGLSLKCDQTRMTQEGTVLGTAMFMAPETLRGEEYCAASDIYQLGLVVYYALTAKYLDRSMASLQLDIKRLRDPKIETPKVGEAIAPDIGQAINLCCQKIVQKRPANGSDLVQKLEQIKTKENETALVEKVEDEKETKSPLRPVHFFWLMLVMALFALYIRYEEVKPATKLALKAQEQKIEKGILLFPNGFFWTFRNSAFIGRKVRKGKTFAPYWKARDKEGSSRQGKFRKFKGAWVAECMGLRPGEQLGLSIVDGGEELFKRDVTVPNEKPDLGLRVRRGIGWADISWSLPVPIPIEVFIGEEFGQMRLLGSFVDKCHYTGKEAQGKQPMRYRLALGERTLFNGSCFPGFRQRFRLPAKKLGSRNTPSAILFDDKGTLDLLFGSDYVVSLKHTETTSGSMMVPQWYFNCKAYEPLERPEAASYKDSTLLPLSDDFLDVVFGQHKPSLVTLYRKQQEQKKQVNKLTALPSYAFAPMAVALPNGRFVIAGSNEELLLQCYLGMSDGKMTKLERLISCEYVSEICWEGERLYLCCWQGKRASVRCFSTKGNELRALWSMPLSTLDFRKEGLKQRNVISMGPRPGKKAGVIVVSGALIYCFKHKGGSEMEAISYRIQPSTGKLSSPTVELDDDTVGFLYITPEPGSVLSMYEGRFMSASFKDKPQVKQSPQKWSFSGNVRKTLISRPQRLGNNKILSGAGLCVLLHSTRAPYELINRIVVPWGVRHAFIHDGVLYVLDDDGVIRGTDLEGSYE